MNKKITCLNCGNMFSGNFCPECGQKNQPLTLPLKDFIANAVENLFNIDNRLYKTIKDLFLKPGSVTIAYLDGKRIRYLSPIKIYFSASILYFLVVTSVDTKTFMFITIEGAEEGFSDFLQNLMIFLVPAFAAIIQLIYRKLNFYYVEYLVFTLHLFTVWFFFFGVFSICEHLINNLSLSGIEFALITLVSFTSKIAQLLYLGLFIKRVFKENWFKSVVKSFFILFFYAALVLAPVAFFYIKIYIS